MRKTMHEKGGTMKERSARTLSSYNASDTIKNCSSCAGSSCCYAKIHIIAAPIGRKSCAYVSIKSLLLSDDPLYDWGCLATSAIVLVQCKNCFRVLLFYFVVVARNLNCISGITRLAREYQLQAWFRERKIANQSITGGNWTKMRECCLVF